MRYYDNTITFKVDQSLQDTNNRYIIIYLII